MIFNTFAYFLLFLLPAAILFSMVKPSLQPWVCITFGAAFFLYFSITQVGGIPGACCILIFLWESCFSRLYKQGSLICLVGIAQSVLFLVIFKYWNFLTGLFFPSGHNPAIWAGAFLPLGISFFTFEFIHYAVDRYRGKTLAGSFAQYLAFILFFPTMVAGPIKRYQNFLPNIQNPDRSWPANWQQGITRIMVGLVKKFALADFLTAVTVHLNSADIAAAPHRWLLIVWILAYGGKIYFDFSGYSDIAIGSARLFGIQVPENFDWPYLRTNIAEFWGHWHMSLYRWLIDYIFIPLGGSRVAPPRVYLNVLITMFLSGLWHGAGFNFIVWGLYHGVLLCAHRLWHQWRTPRTPTAVGNLAAGMLTFSLVTLGWAFFCLDLPTAGLFFKRLFIG